MIPATTIAMCINYGCQKAPCRERVPMSKRSQSSSHCDHNQEDAMGECRPDGKFSACDFGAGRLRKVLPGAARRQGDRHRPRTCFRQTP
jgi:hypothetical protein